MTFKRWLRSSGAFKHCFVMLFLGLALVFLVQNNILKILGFCLAGSSLLLMIVSAAELDQLFWKSELEWWDEDDTRFEDWKRGL